MPDITNLQRSMKIRDILLDHTDEDHELSLSEIANQLKIHFGSDYKVSRNTIKTTLVDLHNSGFQIEEAKEAQTDYYRHQARKLNHQITVDPSAKA